jgi:riboflavin kinase/FMN adenylyltransferase
VSEYTQVPAPWVASARGAVVTVGTFDGLHRGHHALLRHLCAKADELGGPSVLVTFEPHPLEIVRPEASPPLLTPPDEKIEILASTGLDHVIFLRFDRRLASYEPRQFVEQILMRRVGVAHLVIGYDHGFGRDRSGDADTLRDIGREAGFGVDVVGPVVLGGEPVSSSLVRKALERGDVVAAANALGRPYTLAGTVVHGEGRGRKLGFPTANLRVPDARKLIPLDGIYAVHAELRERSVRGLVHLGPRPTFGDAARTVELFAFDFDGDLYGSRVRVAFCQRLRGVERFASADDLIHAMESDRRAAQRLFAEGGSACDGGNAHR